MQFGLFGGARTKRSVGIEDSQGYQSFIDYVMEADRLGFRHMFMVEHHSTGQGQVSASMTLLAYLAAKTQQIRLGTAVVVLPWHNPVLIAEQAATLDLLTGGRFDFGVGKGYRKAEFDAFCIPLEEAGPSVSTRRSRSSARPGPLRSASPITASAGTSRTSWSSRRRCRSRIRRCGSRPAVPTASVARRGRASTCCSTSSPRSSRSASASRCTAPSARRRAAPTTPTWSAPPARCR